MCLAIERCCTDLSFVCLTLSISGSGVLSLGGLFFASRARGAGCTLVRAHQMPYGLSIWPLLELALKNCELIDFSCLVYRLWISMLANICTTLLFSLFILYFSLFKF